MTGRPSTKKRPPTLTQVLIDLLDKTRPNGDNLARLIIHDRGCRPSKQKIQKQDLARMVTKSSAANAERVKRRMGVPLTKSARDNITCRVVKSTAMELAARTTH